MIKYWRDHIDGKSPIRAVECILYTDARITGQIEKDCGPYLFFNTVPPTEGPGKILPYIVLRCFIFENESDKIFQFGDKTDNKNYHGGSSVIDEVSALSSLFLGIRIRASHVTRDFENLEKRPMGTPRQWGYRPAPEVDFRYNAPAIPSVIETRNLSLLYRLKDILELRDAEGVALIRAARLYQDALWVGETDQNLAWIMLVSALETIADCWAGESLSDEEVLNKIHGELFKRLNEECSSETVNYISKYLKKLVGSTKKFRSLCLEFMPDQPATRPEEFLQIDWSPKGWEKILGKVYHYRSKALHEGTPFPLPMGEPPFRFESDEALSERGTLGLAASQANASWVSEDLPINLNLFTDVTRKIILKWIERLAEERRGGK